MKQYGNFLPDRERRLEQQFSLRYLKSQRPGALLFDLQDKCAKPRPLGYFNECRWIANIVIFIYLKLGPPHPPGLKKTHPGDYIWYDGAYFIGDMKGGLFDNNQHPDVLNRSENSQLLKKRKKTTAAKDSANLW